MDRILFDLTIRFVDNVRSEKLAKSIAVISRKLEDDIKGSFSDHLWTIGLPLAQRVSLTAQKLENNSSINWALDISFALFLVVTQINNTNLFEF